MKKFLLLAGVACLFGANANAFDFNQYISGKLSYDVNKVTSRSKIDGEKDRTRKTKELISSHVAYGIYKGHLRGELELNNSHPIKFGATDGEYTSHFTLYKFSLMANGYYDFVNCSKWTPYVGAGLGMSWLKARMVEGDTKILNKHVNNLAWQVMAGVVYQIDNRWAIDAGYRYADLGRVRKNLGGGNVAKFATREHDFMLGVRLSF